MVEETSPQSGSGKTHWIFAIHHIISHEVFKNVEGAREILARIGIYEESRGNKIALLADALAASIANEMPGPIKDALARAGFGFDAHPRTDFHRNLNTFLITEADRIANTPGATVEAQNAAMKVLYEFAVDVANREVDGVRLADSSPSQQA